MKSPLDWSFSVTEIGDGGRREERRATAAEREALAKALSIQSCGDLVVRYEMRPLGSGRYSLNGAVEADVTQSCVVTLDPIPAHIADSLEIEFRPADQIPAEDDGTEEREILTGNDVEAIEDHSIPLGRIVFEHISAVLDPYPRKPGVEFDWQDPKAEADAKAGGAFAALARLKEPK